MAQGEYAIVHGLTTDTTNTAFTNPKITNPKFNTYPKRLPIDNFIQRGYLRLLGENHQIMGSGQFTEGSTAWHAVHEAASKIGGKLDFQFNPNQLTRAVTARTDTQLWINQSPSMLLTPGIGDMTFGWQMLFNREAEVQDNYIARTQRQAYRLEHDNSPINIDALIETFGGSSPQVVSRIGVLADIMVLDTITGQKLTQAIVDYSNTMSEVGGDAFVAFGDSAPTEDEENAATTTNLTGGQPPPILTANMTNAAFLIPHPIRAVFSENFMVDGYVNQVTVSLQKFSPEMVPTVAFVDISMHAIYQGFARKTTVFTHLSGLDWGEVGDGGANPASGESQRQIATDQGDETFALQDAGYSGSGRLFAGFDHSPNDTGEVGGHLRIPGTGWDLIPTVNIPGSGDAQTYLRDHRFTGAGRTAAGSEPCQVDGGKEGATALSFGFASSLVDSDLGRALAKANRSGPEAARERDETFERIKERLGGDYWVGMALRARLKARGSDDSADDDYKLKNLRKLWSGDEGGFTDYETGDHFFGHWSADRRKQMFAIGIDNLLYKADGDPVPNWEPGSRFGETNGQASGFFTRSFPVTELPEYAGVYGDEFHRHHGTFDNSHINYRFGDSKAESSGIVQYGWMWLPDQKGFDIPSTEFNYLMAKGFYTASRPFAESITLRHNEQSSNDIVFDVEYQWVITYRVRLLMDNNAGGTRPISDTGIIWVYPRTLTTDIIKDIANEGPNAGFVLSPINHKQLGGSLQGDEGTGIVTAMEDGFWLSHAEDNDYRNLKLFYDDLNNSEQAHTNSKVYAKALSPDIAVENPRIGGMSISNLGGVQVDMNHTAGD